MALIDKASLLFVPSVVAEGKAFNILPSGNRAPDSTDQNSGYDQTRADFDFDRGSNAAATRVNASGLIEKYRENLLLNSNQFDTTWTKDGATLTSGQADKDGATNAWSLVSTTANGAHRVKQTFTGAANSIATFSVFAKANGYNFLRIIENATTGDFATFDLSDGSVANTTGIANTATIEVVSGADGWYRCSVSVDCGATTRFDIYTMETSGTTNFVGDGVSGAYIMNAQAEKSLVASSYLESTSVTGKAGVLVDLPRINYDANGENGALLLEPSRTNLLPHSEYFGAWNPNNATLTANAYTSPEGYNNAYKFVTDGTNLGYIQSEGAVVVYNGVQHSFTMYFNTNSTMSCTMTMYVGWTGATGSNRSGVAFDVQTATFVSTYTSGSGAVIDYDITTPDSNGWYRVWFTANSTNTATGAELVVRDLNLIGDGSRSEERRVGTECRSRWSAHH